MAAAAAGSSKTLISANEDLRDVFAQAKGVCVYELCVCVCLCGVGARKGAVVGSGESRPCSC